MNRFSKVRPPEPGSALSRLLSDSAVSRALGACGVPLALIDALSAPRPITYANAAFEAFFGLACGEAIGRSLGALILKGDDSLVHRMMAEGSSRREVRAWGKDGIERRVELSLGAVRGHDGRITHWVAGLSDRTELERLRAELDALRNRHLQAAA